MDILISRSFQPVKFSRSLSGSPHGKRLVGWAQTQTLSQRQCCIESYISALVLSANIACYLRTFCIERSCNSMIDDWTSTQNGWNDILQWKSEVVWGKPVQVPLFPPKIPQEPAWSWTSTAGMSSYRITLNIVEFFLLAISWKLTATLSV